MINDRIQKLIKVLDMNPTTFSDSVDVSVPVIFNIIKGRRSKPSYDLIVKILKVYNQVSAEWLIKGAGSMWSERIVYSDQILPEYLEVHYRIKELLSKIHALHPGSYEAEELEVLVSHLLEESSEQKRTLLLTSDRQKALIEFLQSKIKGLA